MRSKAAFLEKQNSLNVKEVELPELSEGLLLEVYSAGVCGTDPHIVNGSRQTDLPIVLGHEFYGKVVDISPNCKIKTTKGILKKNQLITIIPGKVCGSCYYCLNYPKDEHLCISRKIYGVNLSSNEFPFVTGGFSQQVIILNGYQVHPVPKNWELGLGVLLEPFSVGIRAAYKGLDYHKNKSQYYRGNMKVVIQGMGTIGMSILLTLRNYQNLDIYVVEPIEHRQNLALKYGAKAVFKPDIENNFIYEMKTKSSSLGFDMVFEAAGSIAAVNQSILLVRRGGCIIEVGNFADVGALTISPSIICRNDFAIIGSVLGSPDLYEHAESIINKIKFDSHDFLGPIYSIDEVSSALNNVSNLKNWLKTLISNKA